MADELNYCSEGGWLHGASRPISDDPSRYQHATIGREIACNNLKCIDCFAPVRWEDSGPSKRSYECGCRREIQRSSHALADLDSDLFDPSIPWRCDGHPLATLPVEVGGFCLEAGMDFEPLVRIAVAGDRTQFEDKTLQRWPALLVRWIYVRLAGLPEADLLSQQVAALLGQEEPVGRAVALKELATFPECAGFETFLGWLGGEGAGLLAQSYEDREGDGSPTPLDVLDARFGKESLATLTEEEAGLCRGALLGSRHGRLDGIMVPLAGLDSPWLASHAVEIVSRAGRVTALLDALELAGDLPSLTAAGVALAKEVRGKSLRKLHQWLEAPSRTAAASTEAIAAALDAAGPDLDRISIRE